MKKLTLFVIIMLTSFITKAHDITNQCWNSTTKKYSFNCTNLPNGNATIKLVDANNNVITGTGAYTATIFVTGGHTTVSVPQAIRTAPVRVRFTWSDGFVNLQWSGTNNCSVVALYDFGIQARAINGNIQVDWNTDDYETATLQGSIDAKSFTDLITVYHDSLKGITYNLITNMLYYRIKFIKGNSEALSNIVKIPDLDFSRPYELFVYDVTGRLVNKYNNTTQSEFNMSGLFYLKYVQIVNDSAIIRIIKYYRP